MIFKRVVLPEPLGPKMATNSFSRRLRLTLSRAFVPDCRSGTPYRCFYLKHSIFVTPCVLCRWLACIRLGSFGCPSPPAGERARIRPENSAFLAEHAPGNAAVHNRANCGTVGIAGRTGCKAAAGENRFLRQKNFQYLTARQTPLRHRLDIHSSTCSRN